MLPTLYIFSGLPGTGKTTLARMLAHHMGAAYLRVDTLEQGLRDVCRLQVEGEGYRLLYRLAHDNLVLGMSVVADSCNPIALTRREWEQTAHAAGARHVNIEVICSDADEHRQRVEHRDSDVAGLRLPTWAEVMDREYVPWPDKERLLLDTAGCSAINSFAELLRLLQGEE